jgi:hypothetical protein
MIDGVTNRGSRAAFRQVFLPLSVEAPDRATLLQRLQYLGEITNPKNGPGYLYVTDGGKVYRLLCTYKEGMEGDESLAMSGDTDGHWQKTAPTFDAIDPYFEDPTLYTEEYGFAGNIPFFQSPFLPVKLDAAQVLSDVSQPVLHNFIINPSAELDALNWTNTQLGSTPTTITRNAIFAGGSAPHGDWVIQVASTAAGDFNAYPDHDNLTIGLQYTFHGWVYVPAGQPDVFADIFFVASGPSILAKDQWVWVSLPWTATATTDRPVLSGKSAPGAGSFFYSDGLAITEGLVTTPEEYIDGDQPRCHWNGTPHSSSSYQEPLFEPSIISNPGTVESYPVIQVIGPGNSFVAENSRSGRSLTALFAAPLGSGQVATFDFRNKTARLGDTSLYRYLQEDDFWPLLPGDNPVRLALSGASGGSKIIVTWYPRYESIVG